MGFNVSEWSEAWNEWFFFFIFDQYFLKFYLIFVIPRYSCTSMERSTEEIVDSLYQYFTSGSGNVAAPKEVNTKLPEDFQKLLQKGSEWHLTDSEPFGFNIYSKFISKVDVFGDEDLVEEWKDEHDGPNCAQHKFKCFAIISEYEYLFIDVDPKSSTFGGTRYCVNNCDDDEELTPAPFKNFLLAMEEYLSNTEENFINVVQTMKGITVR